MLQAVVARELRSTEILSHALLDLQYFSDLREFWYLSMSSIWNREIKSILWRIIICDVHAHISEELSGMIIHVTLFWLYCSDRTTSCCCFFQTAIWHRPCLFHCRPFSHGSLESTRFVWLWCYSYNLCVFCWRQTFQLILMQEINS